MNVKIIIFCMFSLILFSCEEGENYKSNITGTALGRDPLGFERADLMYSVSDTLKFNEIANTIIRNISGSINSNISVESDIVWNNLAKLEPYRKSVEVQNSIRLWSVKAASLISKNNNYLNTSINEFLKRYKEVADTSDMSKKGDFLLSNLKNNDLKNLADYGRKLLLKDARNLDLRNNLALCQMHLNFDLTSQLELEILRCIDSTYLPCLINLAVVYERIGRTGDAKKLAHQLFVKRNDIPIIQFNEAWYQNLDSNYNSANSVLKTTIELDKSAKYLSFYQQNKDQLKYIMAKTPLLDVGLFKKMGFRDTRGRGLGCSILFLIASSIFWVIIFRLSELIIGLFFLTFYLPYLFYSLFWGSPSGWSILWLVLFYLISILVVSAKRLAKI